MRNIYTCTMGILLLFSFLVSCTRNYFEDDTNLRIYIPEIENKSINNLQLFLHNANGQLIQQKEYNYPFDDEMFIRTGVLRFSLPQGIYTLTCFTDTKNSATTLDVSIGDSFDNSYIGLERHKDNIFKTAPSLRKIVNRKLEAELYGKPLKIDTVSISEDAIHVGKIKYIFKGLPTAVSRVDVYAQGLSSKLYFNGVDDRFSSDEYVFKSAIRPSDQGSSQFSFEDYYFPSAIGEGDEVELTLMVDFFDQLGVKIGSFFDQLPKVSDSDGNLIAPILQSKQTLTISFNGFVFSGISLSGWGEIGDGEITPM